MSLYKKSELWFALSWIIAYVVMSMVAGRLSGILGCGNLIPLAVHALFVLFLYNLIKTNNLSEKYGLCAFQGNPKDFLYFIPLILIAANNLWNGVTMNRSAGETVMYVFSMLCVGFIEEIIFRGFLFKAICKDSVNQAIVISSVTFGMGHIVNLLNGAEPVPTLVQMCYAIAIGFLFTVIFYKGKSLWACIITHGVLNSLSIFAVHDGSQTSYLVRATILCFVCAIYALWIWKKTEKSEGMRY